MFRPLHVVDAPAISAWFGNGVLLVHMPRTAEVRETERKVEVTAT